MGSARAILVFAAAILTAVLILDAQAASPAAEQDGTTVLAQAGGTEQGELSPRYEPVAPEPKSSYNGEYVFGMTRGLADSTIHPAGKGPLFLFTIPLDIVFLPFALIGGLFG